MLWRWAKYSEQKKHHLQMVLKQNVRKNSDDVHGLGGFHHQDKYGFLYELYLRDGQINAHIPLPLIRKSTRQKGKIQLGYEKPF